MQRFMLYAFNGLAQIYFEIHLTLSSYLLLLDFLKSLAVSAH